MVAVDQADLLESIVSVLFSCSDETRSLRYRGRLGMVRGRVREMEEVSYGLPCELGMS